MPKLTVDVPHALGQEQATQRLKAEFGNVKNRFGQQISDFVEQWDGNVLSFGFNALGVQIQGTVTSADSEVQVTAEVPYTAMLFRGTIEKQIRHELEKMLA